MLRTLASCWDKENLDVVRQKIEESEKASSCRESNPGHLACATTALPLSYDATHKLLATTTRQPPALGSLLMKAIIQSTPNGGKQALSVSEHSKN